MKWFLFAIGSPKLDYAKSGLREYLTRLEHLTDVQFVPLKTSKSESDLLLEKSEGMFRIVLDERGDSLTSLDFSKKIKAWENRSIQKIAVLIGGADGHSELLRQKADVTISLSKFTLQHELALVMFAEQLYRAYTINAGLPYHRE